MTMFLVLCLVAMALTAWRFMLLAEWRGEQLKNLEAKYQATQVSEAYLRSLLTAKD